MKLKGKVAIVTGGAQGIGRAIAKRLAEDGAQVAIFDIKSESGEVAAREIGPQAFFLKTDCTKRPEVDMSVARVVEKFGKIDILVTFVQIIPFKRIAQPEEIAAAVAFLASPDAGFVTGQVLSVSGGLTMAG